MVRLSELFMKYGTDKAVSGYAGVYEVLFHGMKPTSLLEVGIGSAESMTGVALENYQPGGSLRAWRDYFETARVFGMDTEPSTQFTEDRIETFLFDSSDGNNKFEHVAGWPGSFDVIIDDGSHNVFAKFLKLPVIFLQSDHT